MTRRRLLFVVNEAYFFLSHRLPVAMAAQKNGFEVHVAAPADHVWAPADFDVDRLREAGFTFHPITLSRRGTDPFQEFVTFLSICRLMYRVRPQLVHLLTIKPVIYGGIAAWFCRVPAVVAAVTGLGQVFVARGFRAALLRAVVTWSYRLATAHRRCRVIVQSAGDRDTLAKTLAVAKRKLRLIRGSGVDTDVFRPRAEPDGRPLVVLPARLIWDKGVAEFVAAAKLVKAAGTDARFALVGDTHRTNPRAVPEATLRAWHEEGSVEWWGRREDMPNVISEALIVCLPSTYGEGVPKVLIEAAACGRPIVATDIAGCREIVIDGENGVLVPPGDVDALAAALRRIIDDPQTRQQMGINGRQLAVERFAIGTVVSDTMQVYREVVG